MTEVVEQTSATTFTETDLVAAVRQVLQTKSEPLTLSKLRAALPSAFRGISLEALEESLRRQVAANVFHQYPKYRSQQNRYWDRPMRVHLGQLLRTTLEEKPLGVSELRRKLPDYAKAQAETVLEEEVAQGALYRHPPLSSRTGPRFGVERPDPKEYLRTDLAAVFGRLEQLGFSQAQLREGALELLHEEEWAPAQNRSAASDRTRPSAAGSSEQDEPEQARASAAESDEAAAARGDSTSS